MVDTSSAAALCYVRLGGGGRGWVVIQTQRQMRARSQKKIFLAPRAHFSLKQTGGGGGALLDPPPNSILGCCVAL